MSPRENAQTKAVRYLGEGRVVIDRVDSEHVRAFVRGDAYVHRGAVEPWAGMVVFVSCSWPLLASARGGDGRRGRRDELVPRNPDDRFSEGSATGSTRPHGCCTPRTRGDAVSYAERARRLLVECMVGRAADEWAEGRYDRASEWWDAARAELAETTP